ncbi:hypothetical protein F5Y06DRAFT_303980 [Hypoxylon sp. FL0890]|nr:hypothetical protein F5Y06DRAFT_303980 [Hypoxylon sp. FL0890]
MADFYSRRSSDSDRDHYEFSPVRRSSIYSPPRRRQSYGSDDRRARARFEPRRPSSPRPRPGRVYDWSSDDSYTYRGSTTSPYYISDRPQSSRGPRVRRRSSAYDDNWNESDDDHTSEVETRNLFVKDSSLIFQEVEDEGLSKTFMIPKSQQGRHIPLNFASNPTHREWHQPEATFEDGSVSKLFAIHASEYSLNKDGRQKVRLLCPDRPPSTESDPSVVQFRWLHLQKQYPRLDDLEKLVINSPCISGQLKAVTLNVLDDIRNTASRKLIGRPHVETESILRGINRYDVNDDLPDEPVIFLSSPYLLMNRQPSLRNSSEGHHMLNLLESLYGYDVGSDRRDTGIMKRMSLGSSKDTLCVPRLWCLLVGNDVLITLSELPVHDLAKGLIEIDQKTSNLRRPLTVKVLDQYSRPHSVVIDADCNYVDFLRHTFALAKEEAGTYVTDYELLNENRELVTPQEWLTLIQQGKLQDTILYIVPRYQLQQQRQSRESRSRSRSQLRRPRYQGMRPNSPLAITRERRPYIAQRFASRVLINDTNRDWIRPTPLWITENRTISPEPRSDYDPEKWALVKYQHNRNGAGNLEGSPMQNGNRRKLITWQDEAGDDQREVGEEGQAKRSSREQSTHQDGANLAEDMQVISRRPTEYTIRSSSGVSGTLVHRHRGRRRSSLERGSLSRSRQTSFPVDISPLRRDMSHASNSRRSTNSYGRKTQGRGPNTRFYSRGQRSRSRAKGPSIIVNDATYAAAKPKLLTLGALSDNGQNPRLSSDSLDIESDNTESSRSHPTTSDDNYTGDSRERSTSSHSQRRGRSQESNQTWNQEDSSEGSPESADSFDTDTSSHDSTRGQYPRKGKTTIPAKLVSLRAVIDLGYPYLIEGDTVVLQRALNGPLIDELLKISEYYKRAEARTAEPTVRFQHSESNSSRSRSRSRGSVTRIPEPGMSSPPAASLLPFFHWKAYTDNQVSSSNADVILVQMLGRADQELSSDKLYSKTHACTFNDLLDRHADLIDKIASEIGASIHTCQPSLDNREQRDQKEPAKDTTIDHNSEGEGFPDAGKAPGNEAPNTQIGEPPAQEEGPRPTSNSNTQTGQPDSVATNGQVPNPGNSTSGWEDLGAIGQSNPSINLPPNNEGENPGQENKASTRLLSPGEVAMKSLLDLSQELLGTFLPEEGSAPIQKVCKKFWGAVDEIFRHILWSSVDEIHPAQWVIRSFTPKLTLSKALPRAPTNKKTYADCDACKSKKIYASYTEALDHLHSEHLSCAAHGKNKRPYEDPCFVWLRHYKGSQVQQARNKKIINAVNQFLDALANVKDLTMELHYLVATTSRQGSDSESRPFLPERVFYAFQEILSMYFFTSRQLSCINRLDALQSGNEKLQAGSHWRRIRAFESDAQAAFARACEFLENSKADIILSGITTRSPDTLGIESVGPHFLAAALAANLQNRPLLPDTETDAVQIYQEYTSKLRYQAYRRPRRRVFLEIHRLQEDLEALQNVVFSQLQVLDNYKRLLAPGSYRVTDSSRKGLFRIESRYIDSQIDRLRDRNEELRVQRQRTNFLKEQVKQTIEILEENHGKAIRVFTIVTVFFLPLSFISSFFGMNTTDIRDTDYDQRFFWTVAIPVTFVVLALAFFYGYKGDSIEERVLTLMHARSERRHQEPPPKKTVTWGTATSENTPVENTSRHRLPSWLKPTRRRKQGKGNSGINRRTTDMSYLST